MEKEMRKLSVIILSVCLMSISACSRTLPTKTAYLKEQSIKVKHITNSDRRKLQNLLDNL